MLKVIKEKLVKENILPLQEYDENQIYINSPYLIKIYFTAITLIFNTLSQEVIEIYNEDEKDLQWLVEHWYKIPKDFDYDSFYLKIFNNQLKTAEKKDLLKDFNELTILTSFDCNANCYYCYEKKYCHNLSYMTKDSADKIISLIKNTSKKDIIITWFGGEPLINQDIIDYLSEQLKNNQINFSCNIITNGLLFNQNNILKAKELWNLKQVQITLDGINDKYDQIKGVEKGSFNIVINNIKMLLQNNISVAIRINVGNNNYKECSELLDYLYNNLQEYYGKYSIYIHEIFGTEFEKNTYDNIKKLFIKAEGLFGISFKFKVFKNHYCMADSGTSLLITPEGNIGVCEHRSDLVFTDLDFSFFNNKILEYFSKYSNEDICKDCPLRPVDRFLSGCEPKSGACCSEKRKQFVIWTQKKAMAKYYLSYLNREKGENIL